MKRKIAVLIINRANYGRLKPVLGAIQDHPGLELQTLVGSSMLLSGLGEAVKFMKADRFPVSAVLPMAREGEAVDHATMVSIAGRELPETVPQVFSQLEPDIVLVHADRFEIIPVAMAAAYMNIPVAHTLGGEVTGTIDETVRHAVTKIAHIHFPATEKSKERILRMGEDPKFVFMVGCATIDFLKSMDLAMDNSLQDKYKPEFKYDLKKPYFVVMQHPVTTDTSHSYEQMMELLEAVAEFKLPTLIFRPNIDAGGARINNAINTFKERHKPDFIVVYKNMIPEDYSNVLANAVCAIGNSSSFIREGSYLGTPAVVVGNRQMNRERAGNVMEVGYNRNEIKDAIQKQLAQGKYVSSNLYGDGQTSERVANILSEVQPPIQKNFHDN